MKYFRYHYSVPNDHGQVSIEFCVKTNFIVIHGLSKFKYCIESFVLGLVSPTVDYDKNLVENCVGPRKNRAFVQNIVLVTNYVNIFVHNEFKRNLISLPSQRTWNLSPFSKYDLFPITSYIICNKNVGQNNSIKNEESEDIVVKKIIEIWLAYFQHRTCRLILATNCYWG